MSNNQHFTFIFCCTVGWDNNGKGVRPIPGNNGYNTIYIKSMLNRGVRRDNTVYIYTGPTKYISKKPKPCICGSFQHSRRTHISCLLNARYEDIDK